jgi:hypothetical protein
MTRPLRMGAARRMVISPTTNSTIKALSVIQRNKRQRLRFRGPATIGT